MMLIFSIMFQLITNCFKDIIPGICIVILLIFMNYSNSSSTIMFTDECSVNMIIMSSLVFVIMSMFVDVFGKNINILLTFSIVVLFFSSSSFLMMYIMFEASLLPIMLLIIMYGNQPERILATRYMLMYTTLTSIPLFIILVQLINQDCIFMMLMQWSGGLLVSQFVLIGMIAAFLVKIPMFLLHTWLPKAHVEAPVEGSMILAGIMLKMGVYGVIRMTMIFYCSNFVMNLLMSLFLLGSIISCWISISADDMKMNVAFSSVGHMNFMMAGLLTLKKMSLNSCILIMVSHGLCSALLFFLVTMFYCKSNSRSFIVSKGSLSQYPIMMMMMFLGWIINLACPPSISFAGEILCLSAIMSYSFIMLPMIMMYIIMNSFFCVFSYGIMSHSNSKIQFKDYNDPMIIMMVSFSLTVPLIFMFISLEMIICK